MSSDAVTRLIVVSPSDAVGIPIEQDAFVQDRQLKYKLRSINLMKHNPSLFVNRGSGLYEMIGGDRTAMTVLGCGVAMLLYRMRANKLRLVSTREGIWFNNVYFWFGTLLGSFYSACFFFKWQIFLNDYYGNFLLNRFADSKQLHRRDIYRLKDKQNEDECYAFSQSFINSYHM